MTHYYTVTMVANSIYLFSISTGHRKRELQIDDFVSIHLAESDKEYKAQVSYHTYIYTAKVYLTN